MFENNDYDQDFEQNTEIGQAPEEKIPEYQEPASEYDDWPQYYGENPDVDEAGDTHQNLRESDASRPIPGEKRKKKSGVFKWVAVITVTVALIVGSTLIASLIPKEDISTPTFPAIWPTDRVDITPDVTAPPASAATGSPTSTVPAGPIGSGTTLQITEPPENGVEGSLQDIYKKSVPSVVGIEALVYDGYYTGTGIIMSKDGFIITNAHVIEGAEKIIVTLYDDREYEASLVGSDEQTDLAVLKIEAKELSPAEFGNSDALEVGDRVVAIGNPLGQSLTMTDGIISATSRDITYGGYTMSLLQTNAALNEGNSGGPLINMYGQVIGITNMKMISYYSSIEGIGFAIPGTVIKAIADELLEKGYVSGRPTIGITVISLNEYIAQEYNVDISSGVYVDSVAEGSDAYKKGMRSGDVIVAVDGVAISTVSELQEAKNELAVGGTMLVTIYRDGNTFDLEIMLVDSNTIG